MTSLEQNETKKQPIKLSARYTFGAIYLAWLSGVLTIGLYFALKELTFVQDFQVNQSMFFNVFGLVTITLIWGFLFVPVIFGCWLIIRRITNESRPICLMFGSLMGMLSIFILPGHFIPLLIVAGLISGEVYWKTRNFLLKRQQQA